MADEDNYSTQSLLVLNVTKDHNGKTVTCHAEHMAWQVPAVTVASLDVLYEPAFSISREPGFGYPIVEGMSVSLKCIIDANPKSEAKWIKDGDMNQSKYSSNQHQVPAEMRTNSDGELYLPAATVNSSGWYRCATDHRFGHFASFGYYLNVRTELPNLQHVLKLPLLPPHSQSANSINKESRELVPRQPSAAGPDVVASGVAPARAQAEHELPPSRQMATYQASSSRSGDIMINSGLYLNSNHGTQQPKNGHPLQGLVDQQLHQSQRQGCPEMVGRPIVVATNRTVMAFLGRPISVSAEFCCSPRPKKVYWVHRHLAMAPGRIIGPYITKELSPASNSRNCYMSTFDIDSVKLEDAGEIMFLVSNSKGLDETDILLNVTRAGYSVSSADHCWFSSKCLSSLLLFVIIIPTVIIGFE
ncbi:hypothetical protein HDE_02397 [Halotydeus destructor]|nr:hypothetical protein HDE_02397 [Halotydeus destructor]